MNDGCKGKRSKRVRGPINSAKEVGIGQRRQDISHNCVFEFKNDHIALPQGAIYLNAAQLLLEYPFWFRWLERRPDVKPIFVIHDLLPLDFPEYWKSGYQRRFDRRIATATRYGAAFITTTEVVRERLAEELRQRGAGERPIHVAPLPPSLPISNPHLLHDSGLSAVPYFVVLGTIEPRKNHLLLLNIWRQFSEQDGNVPKLIIIGARGWENEQTMDVLDRSKLIRRHVFEVSGLPSQDVQRLLANARALLMPSFAEGYGLPLVEALSLGTPVVASDIPVFHEVTQGCADFLHPLDGLGWQARISSLANADAAAERDDRRKASLFRSPSWSNYFSSIEGFLAEQ